MAKNSIIFIEGYDKGFYGIITNLHFDIRKKLNLMFIKIYKLFENWNCIESF